MMAKAIATESGLNFIAIKGPEVSVVAVACVVHFPSDCVVKSLITFIHSLQCAVVQQMGWRIRKGDFQSVL
jgi:hypothetical protein